MLQAIRSKAGSFVVKLLFVLLILTFGLLAGPDGGYSFAQMRGAHRARSTIM